MTHYFVQLRGAVEDVLGPEGSTVFACEMLVQNLSAAARALIAHSALGVAIGFGYRIGKEGRAGMKWSWGSRRPQ